MIVLFEDFDVPFGSVGDVLGEFRRLKYAAKVARKGNGHVKTLNRQRRVRARAKT